MVNRCTRKCVAYGSSSSGTEMLFDAADRTMHTVGELTKCVHDSNDYTTKMCLLPMVLYSGRCHIG